MRKTGHRRHGPAWPGFQGLGALLPPAPRRRQATPTGAGGTARWRCTPSELRVALNGSHSPLKAALDAVNSYGEQYPELLEEIRSACADRMDNGAVGYRNSPNSSDRGATKSRPVRSRHRARAGRGARGHRCPCSTGVPCRSRRRRCRSAARSRPASTDASRSCGRLPGSPSSHAVRDRPAGGQGGSRVPVPGGTGHRHMAADPGGPVAAPLEGRPDDLHAYGPEPQAQTGRSEKFPAAHDGPVSSSLGPSGFPHQGVHRG